MRRWAGAMLLLAGEPGIGKTWILQAAAKQAVARGWTVWWGDASAARPGALRPLLEALACTLKVAGPHGAAALAGCAWLSTSPRAGSGTGTAPSRRPAPEQERRLIHAAVGASWPTCGAAGSCWCSNDLQWAARRLDLIGGPDARRPPTLRLAGLPGYGGGAG